MGNGEIDMLRARNCVEDVGQLAGGSAGMCAL